MKWHLVHIPKTGGQSMEAALGLPNQHETAKYVPRPRFAFVRHPFDRLVSAWHYAAKKGTLASGPMTAEGLKKFFATGHVVVLPMSFYLDDEVDFLGRYERLDEDWKHISDIPLPHLNKGERGPWQQHLDAEMQEMAARYYREDFTRFGYELR